MMIKECNKLIEQDTSKDLVSEKEEIKCDNITKWYKKWFNLMILQKKPDKNILQIDCKFHAEYL